MVAISVDCFLLQGMVFDLENNCTLHVDLAKSNSRSKRSRTGGQLVCTLQSLFLLPHIVVIVYQYC